MDTDSLLVVGVAIGLLAVAAVISAFSGGRSPRLALVLFVSGGGIIAWVLLQNPNTYTLDGFPNLVIDVIGRFIR